MSTPYGLKPFIRALNAIVAQHSGDPLALCRRARPLLEGLVSRQRGLDETPAKQARQAPFCELLHGHPEGAYTIWRMEFPPGAETPIHDHGVWGLVGVCRGEEREERFIRTDRGEVPNRASLEASSVSQNKPGAVTMLIPPDDDIHRISNVTDAPACSIHIYGGPEGTTASRAFDLTNGAIIGWEDAPLAAAQAWGVPVDLRTLLGVADAADDELLAILRRRFAVPTRAEGLDK